MNEGVDEIYVTVFQNHDALISLLARYGFKVHGYKTTHNGTEIVLLRKIEWLNSTPLENYPLINTKIGDKYLLALYPKWHTKLLPDSKLISEGPDIICDTSHANSIRKIYVAASDGASNLKSGDMLVIYRTGDNQGPAFYRAVATSICVVEDVRRVTTFNSERDFIEYCEPFSVFTGDELSNFYKTKRYPYIIKFTYNISLPKRVTRKVLIERAGIDPDLQWSCIPLTDKQFQTILIEGKANARFIVN